MTETAIPPDLVEVSEKIKDLSDRAVSVALLYDGIRDGRENFEPIAHVLIVSDGRNMGGGASGVDLLSNTDKVDLVAHLIKRLGITMDDIEETTQLSDEVKLMAATIKKGRIL